MQSAGILNKPGVLILDGRNIMSETVKDVTKPVPTTPGTVTVNAEEMESITAQMGVVPVGRGMMRNIERLGIGVEQMGVVRIGKGAILLSQQLIISCMQKIAKRLEDPELSTDDLRTLAYTHGYLTSKLAAATKVVSDIDEGGRALREEADKKRRSSFIPGAVVSQHNYYGPVTVPAATPVIEVKPA